MLPDYYLRDREEWYSCTPQKYILIFVQQPLYHSHITKTTEAKRITSVVFVGRTGLEPVTSAVWRQRSKPTGLTSLFEFLRCWVAKTLSVELLLIKKNVKFDVLSWGEQESNLWPHACQACALNQLSYRPICECKDTTFFYSAKYFLCHFLFYFWIS